MESPGNIYRKEVALPGEVVRLVDMTAVEDLQAQAPQNFIPVISPLRRTDPTQLISFAFDHDHIVTADRKGVRDTIRQEIAHKDAGEVKNILVHYENELTRSPRVTADALARTLQNRGDVQFLLTSRLRKERDKSKPRQDRTRPVLIVQRVSRSGTKTLYSKALPIHTAYPGKWFGPPVSVSGYLSKLALNEPAGGFCKRARTR